MNIVETGQVYCCDIYYTTKKRVVVIQTLLLLVAQDLQTQSVSVCVAIPGEFFVAANYSTVEIHMLQSSLHSDYSDHNAFLARCF